MTSIYPKPPSDQSAQFSAQQIFEKEGKKYAVQTEIIKHGTLWKIWQGSQAAFLTLITLGIGFAFGLKGKWEKAVTGQEEVHVINRYPPPSQASTTEKMEVMGNLVKPPQLSKAEKQKLMALEFINQFDVETDSFIKVIPLADLERKFKQALSVGTEINKPEDINILLRIAKKIDRKKALETKKTGSAETLDKARDAFLSSKALKKIEPLKLFTMIHGMFDLVPVEIVEEKYNQILSNPSKAPENINTLIDISENIAVAYEKKGQKQKASDVRQKAQDLFSPEILQKLTLNQIQALVKNHFKTVPLEKLLNRWESIAQAAAGNINTLIDISESIAHAYEKKGQKGEAAEVRQKAEALFSSENLQKFNLNQIQDLVRNHFQRIPLINLQNLLKSLAQGIADPEEKTTLLTLTERVAQEHVDKNDFESAIKFRIEMAQLIKASPPFGEIPLKVKSEHPAFGFRIHPIDTSLFKNHSMAVQSQKFENGETRLHLEAKLTHPSRAALQKSVDFVTGSPDKLLSALPRGFCQGVTVASEQETFFGRKPSSKGEKYKGDFSTNIKKEGYQLNDALNTVINFKGIGQIKIGSSPDQRTVYNRISVDLEPHITADEAVSKLNIMFAALGLGAVAASSRPEDQERIKIMQLFRAFYPKEAYSFEQDQSSYTDSIEVLKDRIGQKVPKMKDKFKHYLEDHPDMMYLQEVYPGQAIWAIKGLADEVKKAGGMGLMAGIGGSDFDDAASRLVSIFNSGALSTLDRHQHGIIALGASAAEDYASGGAESVFVRLITSNMTSDPNDYTLHGEFQILYDLTLLERGGYCHRRDAYGTKDPEQYQDRPSIIELTQDIQKALSPYSNVNNEVGIRNRIPPKRMKGLLARNQADKDKLVKILRNNGLITVNDKKEECVNDVPIDQFIHIGHFKKEYWA